MPPTSPRPWPGPDSSSAAIRRLAEHGYDATTAEDLADAVGMSRSTFFRRFGSKDDVVFADHDHALARLEEFLGSTDAPPDEALVRGTADVLRHLARDPEAARLRFDLMRETPSLRDRELIITHRYERVFSRYLKGHLPEHAPTWVAGALAAVLVSVHNTTLRDWLRGGGDAPRAIEGNLAGAIRLFSPWLTPEGAPERKRVLVAVFDADGTPESVLGAVAAQLDG